MKKTEVQLRDGRPAVNVKVYNFSGLDWAAVQEETDERYSREWYEERLESDNDLSNALFEWACQDGWEMLQTDAEEVFGRHVKVYQEGRSGGWAVVHELPEVWEWDAIMLGKWARFEKYARLIADDVPYRMAVSAYFNVWEPEMAELVDAVTLG